MVWSSKDRLGDRKVRGLYLSSGTIFASTRLTASTRGNNQYHVESLVYGWAQSIETMVVSSQMVGPSMNSSIGDQVA